MTDRPAPDRARSSTVFVNIGKSLSDRRPDELGAFQASTGDREREFWVVTEGDLNLNEWEGIRPPIHPAPTEISPDPQLAEQWDILATGIANILRVTRQPWLATERPKVYLAQCSHKGEFYRKKLFRQLEQIGYEVRPKLLPSSNPEIFEGEATRELERCRALVYIIDDENAEPTDQPCWQLKSLSHMARKAKVPIRQIGWADSSLNAASTHATTLLSSKFVIKEKFDAFQQFLDRRLSEPIVEAPGPDHIVKLNVLVTSEPEDTERALQVQAILRETYCLWEGGFQEAPEIVDDFLNICHAVLLINGSSSSDRKVYARAYGLWRKLSEQHRHACIVVRNIVPPDHAPSGLGETMVKILGGETADEHLQNRLIELVRERTST